jgi:hypothetical protein
MFFGASPELLAPAFLLRRADPARPSLAADAASVGIAKVRIFFMLQKNIAIFAEEYSKKHRKWPWRRDMSRCCCL